MGEPDRITLRWGRVPAWWLVHPEVDADGFCVLAALATYADEFGVCVPSQATLARHLGRSRPWVNRVVSQLAASGLLEKQGRSRGNGGTTSCLYRLRLSPRETPATQPKSASAVDAVPRRARPVASSSRGATEAVPDSDTPSQVRDTNQPQLLQNHTQAPHPPVRVGHADADVGADWEPEPAVVAQALRLCPDADLAAHTARFRARCRANGYRYRAGCLGDAWLAWLLEDHRPGAVNSCAGRGARGTQPGVRGVGRGAAQPSPALRYEAWATAAAAPPFATRSATLWS